MKIKFVLFISALVLLTACTPSIESTPQAKETSMPAPYGVTFCDIDPGDICLEGFGLDIEENLLVLFKVFEKVYEDIYIRADGPDGEIIFRCQHSEGFTENVYCLGEPYPEGELIKLNIYDRNSNKLTALGVFKVQFGDLPEPDFVFEPETTPTAPPAVISSATPSYPNPIYPNPAAP